MPKKAELVTLPNGKHLWPTKHGLGQHLTPPRSDRQCRTWMKRDDWRFGDKNFIIEDINEWRREAIADHETESVEKKRLDLDYKYEQARLTKIRADVLEGKFMDRVDHDRIIVSVVKIVRAKIEEWVEGLPPQLADLPAIKIREIIRDRYDELCRDMYGVAFVTPASDRELTDMKQDVANMKDRNKVKPRPYGGRPKNQGRKK